MERLKHGLDYIKSYITTPQEEVTGVEECSSTEHFFKVKFYCDKCKTAILCKMCTKPGNDNERWCQKCFDIDECGRNLSEPDEEDFSKIEVLSSFSV